MRLADRLPPPPLLALVGASAEWHAGVPPACAASVRLLDRVHFTVHRGDCLVVHHNDPAGARVFLAALAGSSALVSAPGWVGERRCAGHLRVRRCAVRVEVVASVLHGWQATPTREPVEVEASNASPVVHLLRASRDGGLTRPDGDAWRRWAERERARGGAVVIVARAGDVAAELARRPRRSARVSEPHQTDPDVDTWSEHRVREIALRHGQLCAWRGAP